MSGWATATIETDAESEAETLAENLESHLDYDEYNHATKRQSTFVEVLAWGYGGDSKILSGLKKNKRLWSKAVIMSCNDTTDSGSGTAYECNGISVSEIDSASGVESARGHDAKSNLQRHIDKNIYMR